MEIKKWYKSKVIWLNIVTFVVMQLQFLMQFDWLPIKVIEIFIGIVAILNIVLRLLTDKKLEV